MANSPQFDPTLPSNLLLVTSEILIGNRKWSVTAAPSQDAILSASAEFEHFPFGLLLWESAIGLGEYFCNHPEFLAGKRVLELGAGVGVSGIVARNLGAEVWQTDHQKNALQLSQFNAAQNQITGIQTFLADWRHWNHPRKYDLVIGADIIYGREMHFYLEQIFRQSLSPGGKLILADPGRPQSFEFAARLEKTGWKFEMETVSVPRIEMNEISPRVDIEIWIGSE